MRKLIAAANWKMNGDVALVDAFAAQNWPQNERIETVFGLPATLLSTAQAQGLAQLAGQDVSAHESGAHTGEISAAMLKAAGCTYAIIGHSERRSDHGEDEALLIEKWQQLKAQGLAVIYCIGESLAAHDAGETAETLRAQLQPIIEAGLIDEQTVIAYEPVWAIGTGKAATPEYAQNAHAEIRQILAEKHARIAPSLRILYGGSVKADNASGLIAAQDIDGFLVGGASLDVRSFLGIIEAMT
ncbi:triose-phosphate isomerase [Suttonella sp. R2A3]|uniref:triose-phosphate isomerase n=1 Tax=Suttonella sp. R2A3 TaxID=2908648 RepID=UPI001F3DBE13|nr:triose-phosphate isomerase [Suttonella sp. R2A3]UJF24125.1 triose-phosphate isomerase [Suttonella sp. R2A3]